VTSRHHSTAVAPAAVGGDRDSSLARTGVSRPDSDADPALACSCEAAAPDDPPANPLAAASPPSNPPRPQQQQRRRPRPLEADPLLAVSTYTPSPRNQTLPATPVRSQVTSPAMSMVDDRGGASSPSNASAQTAPVHRAHDPAARPPRSGRTRPSGSSRSSGSTSLFGSTLQLSASYANLARSNSGRLAMSALATSNRSAVSNDSVRLRPLSVLPMHRRVSASDRESSVNTASGSHRRVRFDSVEFEDPPVPEEQSTAQPAAAADDAE